MTALGFSFSRVSLFPFLIAVAALQTIALLGWIALGDGWSTAPSQVATPETTLASPANSASEVGVITQIIDPVAPDPIVGLTPAAPEIAPGDIPNPTGQPRTDPQLSQTPLAEPQSQLAEAETSVVPAPTPVATSPRAQLAAWPDVVEWELGQGEIVKVVALSFDTTLEAVACLNVLPYPDRVSKGQILRIPRGFQASLWAEGISFSAAQVLACAAALPALSPAGTSAGVQG